MDIEKSAQALEWPTFLRHYSEHCRSAPAKALALAVIPCETKDAAESLLRLTAEGRHLLTETSFSSLEAILDLENTIRRLHKGIVLDGREIYSLFHLMRVSGELRAFFLDRHPKSGQECPRLTNTISNLENFTNLEPKVLHCLEPDGTVKDSATPRLRSLKDEERRIHSEARDRLDEVLQRAFRDGHLQDKFFDFRDGRYLIPVKTEHRNKISGLVVESSTTKATLFMEPASVRECNDRLKQVQLDIEEEIYQILLSLSAHLEPAAPGMKIAYEELLHFDLTIGRARLADYYNSIRGVAAPVFTDDVELEGLYHPLLSFVLSADQIVRSNLILKSRILIISGPNTGGKTVLLKSFGLCAIMARAGFYLPCAGSARLPFFRTVLAQIGDAQNLELSLSSFSGSVLGLKRILELGGESSLVLVDEILHATDPDEATALSRAILEELDSRGAFAVVTTHLNGLKVSHSNFTSASMEFDERELKPTYRLRIGIPGSSRAMEIGERLGLSQNLIAKARSYLKKDERDLQGLVDRISNQERLVAEEQEKVQKLRAELEEGSNQNHKLHEQLQNQKRTIRENLLGEFKAMERESLLQVENTITEYKEKLNDINLKHAVALEGKKRIQDIREKLANTRKKLEEQLPAQGESRDEKIQHIYRQGGDVFIASMKALGTLLSDPNDRKHPAEVLLGNMKMKLDWKQLSPRGSAQAVRSRITVRSEVVDCPPELNLIGKHFDEASALLNLYLDRAARSGRPSVRIIHGMGSGTLRRVVRETLKSSSYELKYRAGQSNEGGEGCTVVEFHGL